MKLLRLADLNFKKEPTVGYKILNNNINIINNYEIRPI
jgi:hypothetical protein